ncbi:hypothetical protein [Winogradskyella tangerina]|uniref:hypothetical protein n=1 Tax=Winogradskyella tangerina TaxID=2023240 RepID=UPI000DBE92D3|nr:hypothetical protein [Winogradskyella tangerina]
MENNKNLLRINKSKVSKFKLRGLTEQQIVLLKKGKLPVVALAGLLGGYSISGITKPVNDNIAEEDLDTDSDEPIKKADISDGDAHIYNYEVPTSVEFADNITEDMNFNEAFQAARAQLGQGGFFVWKGNAFNTYTKEEWEAFSEEDKEAFFKLFSENTNFDDGIIDEVEPDIEIDTVDEEFSDIEEIGTDEEIIEGLNDGEAYYEEDNLGEDL